MTAQIILADWLENIAVHTRAHPQQCQRVLRASDLLLQLADSEAELVTGGVGGEAVWEDEGSVALLRET